MRNELRSHGLWEMTAPPAPYTGSLVGDAEADVVVIGGGYTGLSSAVHLAERGARVAVLEASEIGFGGSGRNVGLVNGGMWSMPNTAAEVLGSQFGERLIERLSYGPKKVFELIEKYSIECEAERTGTLHCLGRRGLQEIETRAEQWEKRGAAVVVLKADETRKKIGGGNYTGALLDKRAGTIQPLAYVRGLCRVALAAGASVFTQSEAITASDTGSRWRIGTATGSVNAEWVIVATDAYGKGP